MDSCEKDLQLAHKQDVNKHLLYTDLPLFSQNFSDICLEVGFWGGVMLVIVFWERCFWLLCGFFFRSALSSGKDRRKNVKNKKGQVT